jgi:hypothetical protein
MSRVCCNNLWMWRIFSCFRYTPSNDRIIVNYEMERMLEDAFVANFKVLSHHVFGETEETTITFSQSIRIPSFQADIRNWDLPDTRQICRGCAWLMTGFGLTLHTHHSELQAITTLSLISALYNLQLQPLVSGEMCSVVMIYIPT